MHVLQILQRQRSIAPCNDFIPDFTDSNKIKAERGIPTNTLCATSDHDAMVRNILQPHCMTGQKHALRAYPSKTCWGWSAENCLETLCACWG